MKTKRYERYQMLLIYWRDILSEPEWHDKDKLDKVKTPEVHTLGFYLGTKKRDLRVAHSLDPKDGGCDVTCIPWGAITKVFEIQKKD